MESHLIRAGSELEVQITSQADGRILNIAENIQEEASAIKLDLEPGNSTLEINTEPHDSASEIGEDLQKTAKILIEELSRRGAGALCSTVIAEDEVIEPRNQPTYVNQRQAVIPPARYEVLYDHIGIHTHVSRTFDPSTDARIMNLFTASHPISIAAWSSSPIWRGVNHRTNYRLSAIRAAAHRFQPYLTGLHKYMDSTDEQEERQKKWLEQRRAFYARTNTDPEIRIERLGGIVRLRRDTIEYRGADTNTVPAAEAEAAFRLGLARAAVELKQEPTNNTYLSIRNGTVFLPAHGNVLWRTKRAMKHVPELEIREYSNPFIQLAREFLDTQDQEALLKLEDAVSGNTLGAAIMRYANRLGPDKPGYWGSEKGREIQRAVSQVFEDSLFEVNYGALN